MSHAAFEQLQRFLFDATGIHLQPPKMTMAAGRLARRLEARGVADYGAYISLLGRPGEEQERQLAVDLLTTNETHFFREPRHFDFLRQWITEGRGELRQVWSAACSSGEEPYSVAMLLAELRPGQPWQVLGTDISRRVLETARRGRYPMARASEIPQAHLRRFCLRGVGPEEGYFTIEPALRSRVEFRHLNLNGALPRDGTWDLILLRNVMIYFEQPVRAALVRRMAERLTPGGLLLVGHSESLNGIAHGLTALAPAIYRREP